MATNTNSIRKPTGASSVGGRCEWAIRSSPMDRHPADLPMGDTTLVAKLRQGRAVHGLEKSFIGGVVAQKITSDDFQ